MDHIYSNTNNEKRKRGTHLNFEDRVTIKVLKQQGFSNRAIAKQLNCSPSTVGYELKRGTADYGGRGRKPSYSAKRGQANYEFIIQTGSENQFEVQLSKKINQTL